MRVWNKLTPVLWFSCSLCFSGTQQLPGNCQRISQQTKKVSALYEDKERIDFLSEIYSDLLQLNQLRASELHNIPSNLLKNCREKKEGLFVDGLEVLRPFLEHNTKYNQLAGDFWFVIKQNYAKAFPYFQQAITADPKKYDYIEKAFTAWAEGKITEWKNRRESIGHEQIQATIRKTHELFDDTLNDPEAPVDLKIRMLAARARLKELIVPDLKSPRWFQVQQLYGGKFADAAVDWERATEIKPKEQLPWERLLVFKISRSGENAEELIPLLRKWIASGTRNPLAFRMLSVFETQNEKTHPQSLVTIRKGLEIAPLDIKLKALEAYSLALNGDSSAAIRKLTELKKRDSSATNIPEFKKTQVYLHQLAAQKAIDENTLSVAIQELNLALKIDPSQNEIKWKVGKMIYEHAKQRKFSPAIAVKKDMDIVTSLLKPGVFKEFTNEERYRILIAAGLHGSSPKEAVTYCEKYEQEYGMYPSEETLIDCIHIYRLAGNNTHANSLIERALESPRFKNEAPSIRETLRKI